MAVFEIMTMLKKWEKSRDAAKVEAACQLAEMLHCCVAADKVRLLDIDDPLFVEYLDGGWDATTTFYDFVKAKREKERAIREHVR